jgi:Rrf2 family protein
MVSKVMKTLAREGILSSHRGVKGGYSLARNPERITVGEVIRVLEGPIGITECAWSPGSCEQESVCPVRGNWLRISAAVRDALDRIPLTEMVAARSPGPLTLAGGPVTGPSLC